MSDKQKIILFLIIAIVIVAILVLVVLVFPKVEKPYEGGIEVETGGGFLPIESVNWENPDKPMSSAPLEEAEITKGAIRIGISADKGFEPSIFEVQKGETIVLAVTSQDEWTHIFKFEDEDLGPIAVGVGPGETRAITFYAPSEIGEYNFFCDVPGHEGRGEKGKMIVK